LKKSVLDFVSEDAHDLRRRLGASDQRKLDEYLYAVRDIERRLVGADKLAGPNADVSNYPRPSGVPSDYAEHVKLMFDMLTLAFQTDTTRIASFMYVNEGSNRSYKEIDVPEGHHDLSHHGNDKGKQEKIGKINRYHVSMLAHLIERLSSIKEAGGSLLDNCLIVYGSGISDGNRHNHDDLPIALFGRGGGTLKPGRHLRYRKDTPLTNLYLSLLDRVGVTVEQFGDSTGRLDGLDG
jgi:hypothetical protein